MHHLKMPLGISFGTHLLGTGSMIVIVGILIAVVICAVIKLRKRIKRSENLSGEAVL